MNKRVWAGAWKRMSGWGEKGFGRGKLKRAVPVPEEFGPGKSFSGFDLVDQDVTAPKGCIV